MLGKESLPSGFVDRMAVGDHSVEIKNYGLQHIRVRKDRGMGREAIALLSISLQHALPDGGEDGMRGTEVRILDVLYAAGANNQAKVG